MKTLSKKQIAGIIICLKKEYSEAETALDFDSLFELLIAVVLSAQTTDKSVNKVTPILFDKYPDPVSLSRADPAKIENILKTIGMYRQKTKNIIALSGILVSEFDSAVPNEYDELITLPGVGRKTANVVLSVGFGKPRIAVDTHVFRVSNRIGLCHEKNVLDTELALMNVIPEADWTRMHHALIWHGRKVCHARRPACDRCVINDLCLYFKNLNS